jgi:hypothetical protein
VIETVHESFTLTTISEGHTLVRSVTGAALIRLTSENASITVNVSGSSFLRRSKDGSLTFEGAGAWLFFDPPVHQSPSARPPDRRDRG